LISGRTSIHDKAAAPVQCVASPGGGSIVSATIRSATEASSFGMREGRVLSRRSPSTPSVAKRSCQRQTQVLDLPVSRMIAFVPAASALGQSEFNRSRRASSCGGSTS
jgi:hypothetical protein